jgi:hypothetical protein
VKLRHGKNAQLKDENIKGVELEYRVTFEGEVHFCEPEQGSILGESNEDAKRRSIEDLLNYLGSLNQHDNLMSEASNKATKPYVFKTNYLCMFASCISNEEEQAYEVIMNIDEDDRNML